MCKGVLKTRHSCYLPNNSEVKSHAQRHYKIEIKTHRWKVWQKLLDNWKNDQIFTEFINHSVVAKTSKKIYQEAKALEASGLLELYDNSKIIRSTLRSLSSL